MAQSSGRVNRSGRRRTAYRPPILNLRVRLRYPAERPKTERDRYGVQDPVQWGKVAAAARRDLRSETVYERGRTVKLLFVVWTIRYRRGLPPDVEVLDNAGKLHRSIGPAPVRGGIGFGRKQKYQEIHTIYRE